MNGTIQYTRSKDLGEHINLDGAVASCVDDDNESYQVRFHDIQYRSAECEHCGRGGADYWMDSDALTYNVDVHHRCGLELLKFWLDNGAMVEVNWRY
jgi:hypothetical protein